MDAKESEIDNFLYFFYNYVIGKKIDLAFKNVAHHLSKDISKK